MLAAAVRAAFVFMLESFTAAPCSPVAPGRIYLTGVP
jgi:hypothetical protein